jgi:hypothetical protein
MEFNTTNKHNIYKQIYKSILTYFMNEENTLNNTYSYYANRCSDSNLTKFETKSNENKILVQSKLNDGDVYIILRILQNLYDNTYYLFDYDYINDVYYDNDIEFSNEEYINMLNNPNDVEKWLDYLTYLVNEHQIDDFENINEYNEENNKFGYKICGMQKYQKNPTGNKNNIYTLDKIMNIFCN